MLTQRLTALYFALAKKKPSIFEELYEYFKEKYFSENLGRYENFKFGTGSLISYNMIVIAIFGGIILAAVLSIYNKRYLGKFVRKIISDGANSPESAKTVDELGFSNHFMIKLSVAGGKTFGKMIRCVEAEEYYATMLGENGDFSPTSPQKEEENGERGSTLEENPEKNQETDENRGSGCAESGESSDERHDRLLKAVKPYKIDVKHDRFYIAEEDKYAAEFRYAKKGTNWFVFIFVVVICLVLAGLVCYLIPDMLQLIDNFLTEIKK